MSAPLQTDLVIEIARAIITADTAAESFERREMVAKQVGQDMEVIYFERGQEQVSSQYYGLKDVLPFLLASSLDAAMVQLSEAVNLVERLEHISDEKDAKEAKRLGEALHRLITSALRAIEVREGHDLTSLGLGHLRGAHRDPWVDPEEALAIVRRRAG